MAQRWLSAQLPVFASGGWGHNDDLPIDGDRYKERGPCDYRSSKIGIGGRGFALAPGDAARKTAPMSSNPALSLFLPDDSATRRLGGVLAHMLRAGDVVLLHGGIGAGKTHLARAVIQYRLGRMEDVPSPTFTLVQTYDAKECEIWHADLYRLSHPNDVLELGLDAAFETAICLIEWPDRLGDLAPEDALTITLTPSEDGRVAEFVGGRSGLIDAIRRGWVEHA